MSRNNNNKPYYCAFDKAEFLVEQKRNILMFLIYSFVNSLGVVTAEIPLAKIEDVMYLSDIPLGIAC
jgi:Na+-transporting NADH:ubiquinone oxidoreductase subunit NqrE